MFNSAHTSRRSSATTIVATMVLATSVVIAGASTATAQSGGTPNKKALIGSWLDTVTFPPESGRPPLKSLVSFHDDGIMTYSDQGTVTMSHQVSAPALCMEASAKRTLRHRSD